ncbi:transporter, major facilitator family protein [Leptospira inadai serovar Lyme str. 10]|uniref:Transporter, major facilitator family protein n=2 Tax=Leptospira inadai serovar Lyme TaxID=293084 RepID=V6HB54_9LEPT|nr:MFS transporter [Leptospira inadai]EQA36786.1 transporter, major facilitator family protein [Leptospira inadai serovar Lyme str. 10]PNV75695.1 MFS transporter [Leptospira inadai serovar Lyme]
MRKQSFILVLTVFIDMMGFSLIFPIFPETLNHFLAQAGDPVLDLLAGWTSRLLVNSGGDWKLFVALFGGIVASLYSVLQFLFAPIWGKLSDRTGRRPVLVFTCTGSFFGYLVWLASGSFSLFVLSRILTGLMGGNISVATAAMADLTEEKDRAKGMGMIGAGIGLGFIAGPSIGGILAHTDPSILLPFFPWSKMTVFPSVALAASAAALVNLLFVLFRFRETLPISLRRKPEGRLHPILGVFDIGSREVLFLSLLNFLFLFFFSGFEFSLNFYLDQFLNFKPIQIGYTFVYIGLIIVVVQGGIIRRISGKIPEKRIGLLACGLLTFGFLLLSFTNSDTQLFLALTFLAMGSAFLNPSISAMVSLFSPPQDQGKNIGLLRSLGSLGRGISPIAFSLVYSQRGPQISFLVSAVLSAVFLILFWFLRQPKKHHA